MYNAEIELINKSLEQTKKAIISFGCSFAEGQGATPLDIVENYDYVCPALGVSPSIRFKNDLEKKDFLKKYPEIKILADGSLVSHHLERKSSFVNILCNDFFNKRYTPINFGLSGSGNKASIAQVNFFPQIKWNLIEELIVIYLPTDPGRFSFVNDEYKEHSMFTTIWPWPDMHQPPRSTLWQGYTDAIYSDKFAYLEAINDMGNLKNWSSQFNYKLIVFPAFTDYTKETFKNSILWEVNREGKSHKLTSSNFNDNLHNKEVLLDLIEKNWPWEDVWSPQGKKHWAELLESYEDPTKPLTEYISTGSPNRWITPCMHPSAKAHRDLAERLYKHITETL